MELLNQNRQNTIYTRKTKIPEPKVKTPLSDYQNRIYTRRTKNKWSKTGSKIRKSYTITYQISQKTVVFECFFLLKNLIVWLPGCKIRKSCTITYQISQKWFKEEVNDRARSTRRSAWGTREGRCQGRVRKS